MVHHLLHEGHEVWTISDRLAYEQPMRDHLAAHPMPRYHPVFFQLSPLLSKLRRRGLLGPVYYHLWQAKLRQVARRLHAEVGFDLAHHVTFGRYWSPSGLRDLGIPFLWGPVGAAESTPPVFLAELPWRERASEFLRDSVRAFAHHDPALLHTARQATISVGITHESGAALRRLGARRVEQLPQGSLEDGDFAFFDRFTLPPSAPFRVICLGRLVHWKGFYLAIRAFASFARTHPQAELWIVGGGPFRRELERTAAQTGMTSRVTFWGQLSHADTMDRLAQAHVLLHPALHEAFGNVCLEAMAAGRPVVCLDLGGPASQVTAETGCVVPAHRPDEAVEAMAAFLTRLADDRPLLERLSAQARAHVRENFSMRSLGASLNTLYAQALAASA